MEAMGMERKFYIFISVALILFAFASAKSKETTSYYKKTTIFYNKHKQENDTSFAFFQIQKQGDKIYIKDSVLKRDNKTKHNWIYIGRYTIRQGLVSLWLPGKVSVPIYSLKDTVNTQLVTNSSFFLCGKVYNSRQDTIINGSKALRFVRYNAGNPGIDVPRYSSVEYIDTSTWLPIYSNIRYSSPWKEISIIRYKVE